ncbi:hypothetical protein SEPCBS119000_000620 [Sporothrix epigloea]|uniref:Uncharacterized protein n=1 Tax=Sporothrix epigloea TaxID=1892477 RepID=A0ABP0D668_9PEZI
MGLRASLQSASRIVRLAGSTLYELLDVGHGAANIVLRASFALFCCGLLLQAISNQTDPYRCTALVQHGAWPPYSPPKVNPAAYYERLGTLERQHREPAPARPFEEWEPAGCRMHEYSQEDISVCLGGKRVLFVGDSAMRVLFLAALRRLDPKAAKVLLHTTFTKPNPRHDLTIESNTVQLQFLWDPWLNSTKLEEEMTRLELGRSGSGNSSADMADLIVIGSAGLWIARNAADSLYFDTFRASAERVVRIMDESILPFGKQKSNNYVFLAPVQIPRYEKLQESRARALAPDRIKRMNDYLGSFPSAVQSHILTAYKDMTYHVPEAYQDTGLHVLDAVAERWIDVPLNARCNGMLLKLPADERPVPSMSLSTTCCAAPLELVRGQVVMFKPKALACDR